MVHSLLPSLKALVPSLSGFTGLLMLVCAVYLTLTAVLFAVVERGSPWEHGQVARRWRWTAILPGIAMGLLLGLAAVQMLPVMFPTADFAPAMRASTLAPRNW